MAGIAHVITPDSASGAQVVDGSLKFNTSQYLTRSQSSGNAKTITYSFWINKLGTQFEWPHIIGADQNSNNRAHIRWNQDSLQCYFVTGGSAVLNLQPTRKFRDYTSSWYHIVLAVDLNQSTSSDRAKLYVNGVLQTDFTYSTYPSSSDTFAINNSSATAIISGRNYDTSNQINALLSQVYFIDGQALGPENFGFTDPLTNTWRPKKYTGTFTGTNTFYLPMDGNSPIGEDKSGNGNDFTPVSFSGTSIDPDVLKDSPSGAVYGGPPTSGITTTSSPPSNYATFNPLIAPTGGDSQGSGGSLSDGNLTIKSGGSTGNYLLASCSPAIPLTGKYYFEFTTISAINTDNNTIGIFNPASPVYSSGDYARINPAFGGGFTTTKKRSGTATNLAGSTNDFSGGDVVNIAIDSDNRSIWFGKNGVYYEGNPSLGTGASYTNLTSGVEYVVRSFVYTSGGTEAEGRINFGQKPFKFSPPDGFQPLNNASIRPVKVITRPDQYVGVSEWSGDDSERQIITGNAPDFVWIKTTTTDEHVLADSVRGGGAVMSSSAQNKQADFSFPGHWGSVKSFDDNGFTIQTGAGGYHRVNLSGRNYAGWCWKAGGSKNTFNVDDVGYASASAAGLSAGTITPTGSSVGTKQGFSIIKYTGNSTANATLPHGLSEAPNFVIIKNMSNDYGWVVLHTSAGTTGTTLDGSPEYYMLQLDSSAGLQNFSSDTIWNPTSTTVKIDQDGGANWVNNSNSNYIMYAWHDVPGLQKFGEYQGNGSADGTFVELGFRPAVVIVKFAGATGSASWFIYDSARGTFNPNNASLMPDRTVAEENSYDIDFLSNGFKLRYADSAGYTNFSAKYVYMAWAESPTVNLFGGGANAR